MTVETRRVSPFQFQQTRTLIESAGGCIQPACRTGATRKQEEQRYHARCRVGLHGLNAVYGHEHESADLEEERSKPKSTS